VLGGVPGHLFVAGDRFAGARVDEEELLFDADGGVACH
jgi:hypothetical protein